MGYSMGGLSTNNTASNIEAIKRLNIGANISQQPASATIMRVAYKLNKFTPEFTKYLVDKTENVAPLIPSFFLTGNRDQVLANPELTEWHYNHSMKIGVSKVFAEVKGANHFWTFLQHKMAPYYTAFF
jgi:hypothetical protein